MTLNITKKKIEKVLELFNHPQTRKIRKNRGKKRRRNNKSFNRKNGRKNLATSTLKKRGGHPIFNGGQVGGNRVETIITKLFSSNDEKVRSLKNYLRGKKMEENQINIKQFIVNLVNNLKVKIKGPQDGEFILKGINEVDSIEDSDFSIDFDDVNVSDDSVTVNNKPVDDKIDINSTSNDSEEGNFITLQDIEGVNIDKFLKVQNITEGTNDDKTKPEIIEGGLEGKTNTKESNQQDQTTTNPPTKEVTGTETNNNQKPVTTQLNKNKPKVESKNDKMMKLLTLREDYTIFNILNNLLPPKEEGQNADLKEIVKKLDFGKFVDEIGILKNDEEEEEEEEE